MIRAKGSERLCPSRSDRVPLVASRTVQEKGEIDIELKTVKVEAQ